MNMRRFFFTALCAALLLCANGVFAAEVESADAGSGKERGATEQKDEAAAEPRPKVKFRGITIRGNAGTVTPVEPVKKPKAK